MKIIIKYDSSWRNSFLDGSNNEPLPKKGRNFIASMTELQKNPENYLSRPVSKDTVMGILNRLIGDQRKLYQSRQEPNYYFADLEHLISFEDKPLVVSNEIAYIRNIKRSEDKDSFTGMISTTDPIFQSNYSYEFWQVLALDIEQLCDFIINNRRINDFNIVDEIMIDPISILNRLTAINKIKAMSETIELQQASDILSNQFDKYKPKDSKGSYLVLPMYCSALYLQMQRLSKRFDMQSAKSPRGGISGIAHNSFTPKDFMVRYTTGAKKLIYGNPYMLVERKKGEGEVISVLHKANGTLEIQLNLAPEQAKDLKQKIEDAGVSAFYLGKKGLAYVDKIVL